MQQSAVALLVCPVDQTACVPLRKVPGGKRCACPIPKSLLVLFVFAPLDFPPPHSVVGSECYLAREQDVLQLPCCSSQQNVKDKGKKHGILLFIKWTSLHLVWL